MLASQDLTGAAGADRIIHRCSCGYEFTATYWEKHRQPQTWHTGDGVDLDLCDCPACGSTCNVEVPCFHSRAELAAMDAQPARRSTLLVMLPGIAVLGGGA